MKNTLLLAAACLLFQNLFAQLTEVKNLHYKFKETSTDKKGKVEVVEMDNTFFGGDTVLLAEKILGEKKYPLYVLDFPKTACIVIMHNRKDYVVDEIDTAFRYEQKLLPTGRTKEINGYLCSEYIMDTNTVYSYHQKGSPYQTDPMQNAYQYRFNVWITEQISFNPNYNPYVLALLRYDHRNIVSTFNGVIVHLEANLFHGTKHWKFKNTLDTTKLNEVKQTPQMPWLAAEPGAALLPVLGVTEGTARPNSNFNDPDSDFMEKLDRKEAFLYKIVGSRQIKTRGGVPSGYKSWW